MVLLIVQRRVDGWYLKSPLHPQCMFYHWYCKSSSEGYLKGVSFTLECMFVSLVLYPEKGGRTATRLFHLNYQ